MVCWRPLLAEAGYSVRVAEDGAPALSYLGVIAFDLILSDVDMPKLSGLALCEQARSLRPGPPRSPDERRSLGAGAPYRARTRRTRASREADGSQ